MKVFLICYPFGSEHDLCALAELRSLWEFGVYEFTLGQDREYSLSDREVGRAWVLGKTYSSIR